VPWRSLQNASARRLPDGSPHQQPIYALTNLQTTKIKIVIIGCGRRGNGNAKAIANNERLELTALVDPNPEAARAIRDELGFSDIEVFTDHKEMLEKMKPDLCVICVWTGLHLEVFRDCVEAGVKAVFMEKPVAATWGECREIERLADSSGCRLSISHQFATRQRFLGESVVQSCWGPIQLGQRLAR